MKLVLKAKIYPTEDEQAIFAIFHKFYSFNELTPSKPNEFGVRELFAQIEGVHAISFLYAQVRKQRIVEAVRHFLLYKIDYGTNSCRFFVHKQALTQGIITLCNDFNDSPLGAIELELSGNNILEIIEYLVPPTEKGKVLEVNYSLNDNS
jgi:predicted RNA binding protein with dsRBD fold (UPF0201 family)